MKNTFSFTKAKEMEKGYLLVSYSLAGHRREYIDLFRKIFTPSGPVKLTDRWSKTLSSTNPVLFLMIEEDTIGFFLSCLYRSILGRATCGLLFRAREAVNSTRPVHVIKRYLLKFLKIIPRAKVITILPFMLDHKLASIASDWIYDPQLWDLEDDELKPSETPLTREIRSAANGRKIIVSLGVQNDDKGLNWLSDLMVKNPAIPDKFLIAVCGAFTQDSKSKLEIIRSNNGFCIDRFITDEEVRALYSCADVIWAAYMPSYDQASGIFGRAVQFGKPAIVRKGSFSESLANSLGHPVVAISPNEIPIAEQLDLMLQPRQEASQLRSRLKRASLETLRNSL